MTLTPDRKHEKPERRDRSVSPDSPAAGKVSSRSGVGKSGEDAGSLFKQLDSAGLDLTGHPLVEKFEAMAAVPTDEEEPSPIDSGCADDSAAAEDSAGTDDSAIADGSVSTDVFTPECGSTDTDDLTPLDGLGGGDDGGQASSEDVSSVDSAFASRHPLLSDATWNDLARFAPEVTESITRLMDLKDELRTFDRPMGPSEALQLIDGLEALGRANEALSTLALSVYERVGTPAESGAKTTKALIQNRLNLSGREAARRTEMAKNLGGRVNMAGQALPPLYPLVADKLHDGTLSAGQVAVIESCLNSLPEWVDPDVRRDAEAVLVKYAPTVQVADLREIFRHMLAHIDPDGAEPKDADDRSMYFVTARARKDGKWDLKGLLDPAAGAELHALLTSRIESSDRNGQEQDSAAGTAFAPGSSPKPLPDQEQLDIFDSVLSGDRYDAPAWAMLDASDASTDTTAPAGYGMRDDGTRVNLISEQPSARNWIYERFATLVSRISMKEAAKGSPYALVVTAKAEDLAENKGEGTTGAGNRIPIKELTTRGLNGTVFFHLMSDIAKTVEVGTENRFANKKQIAIITARDQGCTFPGCDAPPGWCDVNHVVPYSEGGKTEINNLALACSSHHHLMDRSDWTMRMLADGRPAWVPPASLDPAQRPILHSRFIAREIIENLFDE